MLQGAFLAELPAAVQKAPAAAQLVVTITSAAAAAQQTADGGNSGSDDGPAAVSWLQGRLTAAALAAAVPDAATRDLYVSVPPASHPGCLQTAVLQAPCEKAHELRSWLGLCTV